MRIRGKIGRKVDSESITEENQLYSGFMSVFGAFSVSVLALLVAGRMRERSFLLVVADTRNSEDEVCKASRWSGGV